MIQINPGLIQTFVAIEALLVIVFGIIKGGINMRRFVFAGSAVIFAFVLPWVLSHLAPGFGSITTYQLLQRYAEHAEWWWAGVYQFSSKVMLIDAGAMTALNIIEMLGSFGLSIVPQQYMGVLMNLGWTLDPIDAIIESINHASQVLLAIFHTIAWLAWFSWAIAPIILSIALALLIPERTRPMGTAVLLLTLAIMFFTALAASTLGLNQEAQLINSINNTLSVIENDLPQNMTVRGYLLLQSNYPYLVSGQLINETMICGPRGCYYAPEPISWFIGFIPSVGVIDQFAYPQINNATLLWLSVNPNHQCDLLYWPPSRNITQLPEVVQCTYQYLNNNETFAEEITIEGPPLNLIWEKVNGTTAYSGAWVWLNPPTSYTVSNGNNTVTINATIKIPPMQCINVTTRTGPHRVCYPGTASADLWLWASSISYPTSLGGGNWSCTLSLTNSSRYPVVDLTQEFSEIRQFMDKLINETEVAKKLIYPNATVPSYKLPNPTSNGYHQWELSIYCTNWNNYSIVVPLTVTIHGVGNNPWFASVPFLISPSDEWIIDATIIGDEPLIINWWDVDVKGLLGFLGIPIANWLAKLAVIYGLLDGAAWFFGLPTILSPVWAVMDSVIMELSLVLYLQIRAVGRLMQRAVRKITKSIGSRLQGTYQALSNKHPKLAKALSTPSNAVSRARRFLHEHLGSWTPHHRVVEHITKKYMETPRAGKAVSIMLNPWHYGLSEVEARLEKKYRLYESMGLNQKARLYRFAAGTARFVRDYGKIRSLSERGLLFQYTRRELSKLGEEPTQLTKSLVREEHGGLVVYRLSPQSLMEWPRELRRVAPSLARITRQVTQAEVIVTLEELLGRGHPAVGLVRQRIEVGDETGARAIALGKAIGRRLIKPLQAERQLIKEELGEIERALRNWEGFVIKHIGDKTEVYVHDARLTHILESLKSFGGYGGGVDEALGKAIESAAARANLTRGVLRDEFLGEVVSRLKPLRDFVEATDKGAIVSLNHPVIQRFIDFVWPESERVVREVFNTKGLIDKDAANEIINRLKPLINKRVNEEVEAAKYIVAVRHHADEIIKEFAKELGVEKRIGEIEGEVKELGDFVRRVTMSTLPMPRERITNPELFGEFREVGGGRVVLREPLNMDIRIDLQTPKEILNDPELSLLLTAWLTNYYADRLHGWFVRSPGDAIYYTSLYKALTPEAEALNILHAAGINPSRLDWGGLLDEKERIEERMNDLRSRIKEAKDEGEKAKLREELNELRKEYEGVLKVLFHWANALRAFLSTLPSEERERIYEALPNKLRDFIDTAKDPRDVYEAYVKGVALKIEGMKRRSGRRSGEGEEEGWVGIDDVAEMRELIRNRLPMLDALIEPVRAEVIDALTRRVNDMISELGNDQPVRALESARDELGRGNLDNAVRLLRGAIENLRQVAREGEELAMDVRRLDELTKQLEAIRVLDRLVK
jgi:hypothetical protein